jgi:uncharacterized membrane protein (UPF0136 family)
MQNTAMEIWVYGAMMMLGGVAGYLKVHSKASLIAGVGMGLGLLASGFGVWRGSVDSLIVAEVIAALLLVIFAIRLAKTKRFMPAGMLAMVSLLAVVIFGRALGK